MVRVILLWECNRIKIYLNLQPLDHVTDEKHGGEVGLECLKEHTVETDYLLLRESSQTTGIQ